MNHPSLGESFFERIGPASLDAHTRRRLAELGQIREYSAGAVLFREGAQADRVYVVIAGHVALDMHVAGRGDARILTVGPGELLAWSALVGAGRLTATATSLEATRVIEYPAQELERVAEEDRNFGFEWMRVVAASLARRLIATRLQLLDLFAPSGSSPSAPSPSAWESGGSSSVAEASAAESRAGGVQP